MNTTFHFTTRILKGLFLIYILIFPSNVLLAVTASPYYFDVRQPDGTLLHMRMMGDERVKWAETADQFSLVRNNQGGWEYAIRDKKGDLVASGRLAHNVADRTSAEKNFLQHVSKNLRFSKKQIEQMKKARVTKELSATEAFEPVGTKNLLVILVGFQDAPFTLSQGDFNTLLNNATESVKAFYSENSYGQFTLNTTVAGPYSASGDIADYGANDAWGNDINAGGLMSEAVNLANPDVDFSDFDNDNDGYVDGIYVVYAGYGEEAGGGADAIWAHAGYFSTQYLDGVFVNKYACSPELRGNSGTSITGIGVICHELGHSLGAPDYYDVDYADYGQYDGTGSWDMMAGGSWNDNGDHPAHHNAYTKSYVYNWLTPLTVSAAQSLTLRDIKDYPDVVRINTSTANEYFLCENRQLTGYNQALPGHGMIIYHVDGNYIATHIGSNTINHGSHQGMYPMSAVANTSGGIMLSSANLINVSGCPWPGTTYKTEFTDATTPWMKDWALNTTAKPILDIRETDGTISFCVIECDYPGNFTAEAASPTQIDLTWTKNSSDDPVLIAVNTSGTFGTPANGTTYTAGGSLSGGGTILYAGPANGFHHTGLSAGSTRYYKAWSVQSGNNYTSGVRTSATSLSTLITSFPWTEGFEHGGSIPQYWTQENVNGTLNWSFLSGSGNGSPGTAHSGSYNANLSTLNYNYPVTRLISPPLNLTAISNPVLNFWHVQEYWDQDQDELKVYYRAANTASWTLLADYTTNTASWTQRSIALPDASATYYICFEGYANAGFGVCIDDVQISGTAKPFWTGAVNNDWNTAGNWLNNSVPGSSTEVIISDLPNKPVINQPASGPAVCNSLIIQAGGSLTVNPGKGLTVSGSLDNKAGYDGLIIKADASGSGSLLDPGTPVDITIERYIPANTTGYVSMPVSDGTRRIFSGSVNDKLFQYNATTGSWEQLTIDDTPLEIMRGYVAKYATNKTLVFKGMLNTGTRLAGTPGHISLSNGGTYGWNLAGNPYPSALNIGSANNPVSGWTWGSDIQGFVSYRKSDGNVAYWSKAGNGTGNNGGTAYIPPTQAFWINLDGSSSTGFGTTNNPRIHQAQGIYKTAVPDQLFRITAVYQGHRDETTIGFFAGAQDPHDAWDADKFFIADTNFAMVYTQSADLRNLAINGLSPLIADRDLALGFEALRNGQYRLEADFSQLDPNTGVYLEDTETGIEQDLRQNPVYAFTSTAVNTVTRFVLHFRPVKVSGFVVYDHATTPWPLAGVQVRLTDANGVQLAETLTGAGGEFSFEFAPAGSILRLSSIQPASGWNAADALAVMSYFTGLSSLDSLSLKAADVNGSGFANSVDAMQIMKRFVGMLPGFTPSDWIFEEEQIPVLDPLIPHVLTLKGLCTGDVNKSLEY